MQLRGKVAVVTGGAHRVGRAIALALAREGVHLVVHYGRSAEAARSTVEEIRALGVQAVPVSADLHDPVQIDALWDAVGSAFDRVDILVNSAASFVQQPFDAIALADWEDVMQVNLRAPFLCTQRAARLMRQVERPPDQPALIVNITDLSAFFPWPGYVQHAISKGGLVHLTRTSAAALGPDVRVNAIAPGAVLPPPPIDPEGDYWQAVGQQLPLKRVGSPDYVAQTVIFLAQNDYITGVVIPVDGGEHLVGLIE